MALLDHYFGELTKLGYSPAQAAGILGNLQAESKLDPNAVGDKGTSYGVAQWHNERKAGLDKFAASKGLLASDPTAQIQYLDWELKNREPRANKALMAAQTPQEAAAAFLHFERPKGYSASNPLASLGADQRVANAVNVFRANGATPKSQPSPPTPEPPPFTTYPTPQPPPSTPTPTTAANSLPIFAQLDTPINSDVSENVKNSSEFLTSQDAAPQYDKAAMRGLLASLFPQDMAQAQEAPQAAPELPQAPPMPMKRGRGLAFQQLTIKTPKFRTA